MGDDVRLLRRIEPPARSERSRDLVFQLDRTPRDTRGLIKFHRQNSMTPRFKILGDVAKVRNQPNRAEFNQIPETQNSVHQYDVHGAILYPLVDQELTPFSRLATCRNQKVTYRFLRSRLSKVPPDTEP